MEPSPPERAVPLLQPPHQPRRRRPRPLQTPSSSSSSSSPPPSPSSPSSPPAAAARVAAAMLSISLLLVLSLSGGGSGVRVAPALAAAASAEMAQDEAIILPRRSPRHHQQLMSQRQQQTTGRGSLRPPSSASSSFSRLSGMGMVGGGCLGSKPVDVEPPKPFLVYEHDRTDSAITLSWESIKRANFYELQFQAPSGEWRSIFNGTGNFCRKRNLEPDTTYSFRMRYKRDGNFSEFTPALELDTLTEQLASTRMSMPTAESIDGETIRILWNRPPRTLKSEIQVKDEEGGPWMTVSSDVAGASARKRGLKAGHGYIFRTRCLNRETFGWTAYSEPTEIVRTKSLHPIFKELFGTKLTNAEGDEVPVDSLAGKVVALYFSAHWCPPCRKFTPALAEFYRQAKSAGRNFEIVFISQDQDNYDFRNYLSSMPWVAVPFRNARLRQSLPARFNLRGIPTLKIMSPKGEMVSEDGIREALSVDKIARWEKSGAY